MKIRTNLARRLLSCWACGLALPAAAQTFSFDQQSSGRYASAMYAAGPTSSDQGAISLAAWDLQGRTANTAIELLPSKLGSVRFDQDVVRAWARTEQPSQGADATLHAYARASGYYLDAGQSTAAHNEVHLHDTVSVRNGGPAAYFNLVQATHGTLLSGGLANTVTASAEEDVVVVGVCSFGCYAVDGTTPLNVFGSTWSGAASVFASDSTPTVTVSGHWAGATRPFTASVDGFSAPFYGIELSSLLGSPSIWLAPGATMQIDVDFRGVYDAASGSGFLSFGQADFSQTGHQGFVAVDVLTGLPATGIEVTLVSAPVPQPPSAWLLGGGLLAVVLVRRRKA